MARQEDTAVPLPKLVAVLDPAVRRSVRQRFDAMMREFKYLQVNRADDFTYLSGKGWTGQKLEVLFLLNSFYQLAIGPLRASARSTAGLGATIPIFHGADLFDNSRAYEVSQMVGAYNSLLESLKIKADWMTKNTAGDLVYWVTRSEREREGVIYERREEPDQGGEK
ncbi:hypothetical protein ACVWWQ_000793 [Rhodanobacter sp. TND4EL1]